jgi:hypothetical protein
MVELLFIDIVSTVLSFYVGGRERESRRERAHAPIPYDGME